MVKVHKKVIDSVTTAFDLLDRCEESGKIAAFYGFLPVKGPALSNAALEKAKKFDPLWSPAEKVALLTEYDKARGGPSSSQGLCWIRRPYLSPGKGSKLKEKMRANRVECELTALGSSKSVSEGLLLQATRAILENAGHKDFYLRINSVGSKESVAEYERRLVSYIKKKIMDFPPELRQEVKKDPLYLITNIVKEYREFKDGAPKTMDYLNEQSRIHFKEILEFLETINLPYVIDFSLLGDPEYSTETVFEIIESGEEGKVLARGMRWNRLSKKMEFKKEVPAVSVVVSAPALRLQKESVIRTGNSRFYLIQFGPEAKHKSFLALEELRRAGVTVSHSLAKDKLMSQMSAVEQMNVPYVILIGQKEALEGNVLVRNSATRAQTIVPIKELSAYVKTIK
jgi:histidyl-tRNA synthetase